MLGEENIGYANYKNVPNLEKEIQNQKKKQALSSGQFSRYSKPRGAQNDNNVSRSYNINKKLLDDIQKKLPINKAEQFTLGQQQQLKIHWAE